MKEFNLSNEIEDIPFSIGSVPMLHVSDVRKFIKQLKKTLKVCGDVLQHPDDNPIGREVDIINVERLIKEVNKLAGKQLI